ncbi:MAG: ATP-dependent 6-phosphofructokinase [Candidatus Hydrogenedentes bacterium]|nr:ATP-dependent 6-phosphofructokinase [Candidatus Hydrogenedentota bacterium]
MAKSSDKIRAVGILTSGGDCPGLNAVIRAITKTLTPAGVEVFGILEGFTGLVENRYIILEDKQVSGLLTVGGTIIRTSRNKPHKMPIAGGGTRDMTGAAIETYRRLHLECLFCLGGGGTQKNAYHLMKEGGINVITVPKTIDNDVWGTDICFGFDTGMAIATEAIDRLHTTASSHHRVMVVDIMGHNAGWLALGAGIAGGADVILIPEIPYDMEIVGQSLLARMKRGKMFSIVAVAEGAVSGDEVEAQKGEKKKKEKEKKKKGEEEHTKEPVSAILAEHIEEVTGLETRVTSLGHLQRGGVPTPTDRLMCTKFGTRAAECALDGIFGVMVAKRGQDFVPVPLEEIVANKRTVPLDHEWIRSARAVGTCLGDRMPRGYEE